MRARGLEAAIWLKKTSHGGHGGHGGGKKWGLLADAGERFPFFLGPLVSWRLF
jgi:hypothetical protein